MRRWPVIGAVALVVAGCGGPITDDELGRGIDSLAATASEARLVAQGAADDRTKATFVRVSLRDLGEEATHEAEKLNDAQSKPGNADAKANAVRLAQDIADSVGELQVEPADRALAGQVADRLAALSDRADVLSRSLR